MIVSQGSKPGTRNGIALASTTIAFTAFHSLIVKSSYAMLAHSRLVRLLIAVICVYSCAGRFAFDTLPLSSPSPPSWYHHPAIVIPGVILTLPAILTMMLLANLNPHDGGSMDVAVSHFLSTIDPGVTVVWCIMMFFLLNRAARWFEQKRGRGITRDQSGEIG